MGLDGGTYITRSDVLRGQSWDVASADPSSRSSRGGSVSSSSTFRRKQLDRTLGRNTRWTTCYLTGEALRVPIAADFLGNLYNREAVIRFLLARAGTFLDDNHEHMYANQLRESGTAFSHLQSKRDVFTVHLVEAPEAKDSDSEPGPRFMCPITHLPCTSVPCTALATCGHVFSSRALREVPDQACLSCGKPYCTSDDLITLNGSPEAVEKLREALSRRRMEAKAKRSTKRKRLEGLETLSEGGKGCCR